MRPLLGRNNIGVERAGLVETAQRSVHRRVADVVQAVFAKPPNDVIAVAVGLAQHGKHRQIEDAFEKLGGIDFSLVHVRRHRDYYGLRSSATMRRRAAASVRGLFPR